jgi:TP901 family phage tail tape measure protein
MADNITQVFSLDASDALAALSQLNSRFQALNQTLSGVTSQLSSFNRAGSATAAAVQNMGGAFNTGMGQATAATNRLTTSLSLLSRITFTQAVVRGLNELRVNFRDATNSAIEFQTRVAETGAIAGGALGDNSNIAKQVRDISDKFGTSLQDTFRAQYQSISFGLGSDTPKFLETASLFSKASITPLESSVKLIAGTLKSFEKDASQADQVASTFFKTIAIGAVRGTDLAGSFGKVAPLAHQVGVSFEETAAAFATLTQRGISSDQAATAIRGTLTALLKPTSDMTALLHQYGFENGQAAIATQGLGKTVEQILDSTHGQADALAKLVPNVRGLAGVLGGLGSSDYADKLKQIKSATDDLSKTEGLAVLGTEAQTVAKQLQQFQNVLTVDLGGSIVHTLADVTDLTGGMSTLRNVASGAGPALLGIGATIVGIKTASAASALQVAGLSRALGALALVPVAAGVGESIGNLINSQLSARANEALEAQRSADDQELDAFRKMVSDKAKAENDADDARVQAINSTLQKISGVYLQQVDAARTANTALVADAVSTADRLARVREEYANAAGKGSEQSHEIATHGQQRIDDLSQLQDSRQFGQRLQGQSSEDQVASLLTRATSQASEAASRLSAAGRSGNQAGIDQAEKLFGAAQHTGEQAESIASRTNNRKLESQAAAQLLKITNDQISAEQNLVRLQQQRSSALQQEQGRQQGISNDLKNQAKILTDNLGLFDKEGKQYSPEQQTQRNKKASGALNRISQLGFNSNDLSISDTLGLSKFVTEHQRNLTSAPGQLQSSTNSGLAQISRQLADAFGSFKNGSPIDVDALGKAVGRNLTSPAQVTEATKQLEQTAASLRSQIAAAQTSGKQASQIDNQIGIVRQNIDAPGRAANRNLFPGGESDSLRKEFESVLAEFDKVRANPNANQGDVKTLFGRANALNNRAQGSLTGRLGFGGSLEQLGQGVGLLNQRAQAQGQAGNLGSLQTQLNQVESVLQRSSAGIGSAFQSAASAVGSSASAARQFSSATTSAAIAAGQLGSALESAAATAASNSIGLGGNLDIGDDELSTGGMVRRYLATGGPAGTDTIPAMLSPGEMVVNAASTSKFYSQLQAINAGNAPARTSPVQNFNQQIGDIHVNGAGNPKQTAREVVNAIRREQRRGNA